MKLLIFISVCIFQFIALNVFSQQVSNVMVEYDKATAMVHIFYDLTGYGNKNERYQVRAFYSEDEGKNFSQIFEAADAIGDAIEPGQNKKIRWDYFVENPEFSGKDVIFKVEAKWDKSYEIRRLQTLGGPEYAFNSLLIPGWGHQKVTGEKGHWWKSAAIYGFMVAGVYFSLSAQNTYKDYKKSQTETEAQELLDKSKQQGKTGLLLLASGGTLWLSNVVWVALRGAKNKKQLKNLTAAHFESPIQLNYYALTKSPGLTLKFRF